MNHTVHGLAGSHTIQIIGIGDGSGAAGCGCQLPAVLPGEGPLGAIVVAEGIAGGVVGDGTFVKCRQQVTPVAVTIGVVVFSCTVIGGQNVTRGVVGVIVSGGAVSGLGQLVLVVVGVIN